MGEETELVEDWTITLKALELLSAQMKFFENLIIEKALEDSEDRKICAHNIAKAVFSISEKIARGPLNDISD